MGWLQLVKVSIMTPLIDEVFLTMTKLAKLTKLNAVGERFLSMNIVLYIPQFVRVGVLPRVKLTKTMPFPG